MRKNIEYWWVALFGMLCITSLKAQPPTGQMAMGMQKMKMQMHIYGKIVNADGKGVNGASILVMKDKYDSITKKTKSILVKGATTKANGTFDFTDVAASPGMMINVSAIGYSSVVKPIGKAEGDVGTSAFYSGGKLAGGGNMPPMDMGSMPSTIENNIGNIQLTASAAELQGVVVTAPSTPTMRLDIDKKVFNVEKNIVSAGGTGLDVMKNVPGINVDIDGNLSLRNASPTLYIDGRPTTLTVDQIPADAIESVEVITNPSAKYDASGGGAGILNIVLKKNKKAGYNGNLRAGVDKRGAINGGGDLNVRQGKFNVSASAMINQNKGVAIGTTDRNNLNTTPLTTVHQYDYNQNKGGFMFGKLGADFFLNDKTTFSLSGVKVHGEFKPADNLDITTDSLYTAAKTFNFSNRISNSHRVFNGGGIVFGMKQLFNKKGEELTVDANYFSGKTQNNAAYETDYYGSGSIITGNLLQKATGFGNDQNLVIQTDYTNTFGKNTKLETGLRAALRNRESDDQNFTYSNSAKAYEQVANASTHYTNKDNVYAAYVSLSSTIKDFGYKIGVRTESSNYNGTLLNTGEKFSNNYPISLFPSVFVSEKLNNNQELQVSVTRRINRPNFFQLIPYTDYSDSLNITRGNPALVPEFTTSYELSYLKTFGGNNTFLASVYYKKTNNLITRFIDTAINAISGKQDLINTYVNANSSYTTGLELTSINYLTKWWDMSTNLNFYNSKINTSNLAGVTAQAALWSWFAKYNSNFKLPNNFTFQLSATYQSKTNLPINTNTGGMGGPPSMNSQSSSQGYISPSWGMDLAFKKTFLKNNAASITLSASDIFRTRVSNQYSESAYFTQQYNRLRDPQMLRLTFSYKFGKMDMNLFKRTSKGTGESAGSM